MAREARRAFGLEQVVFTPAAQPPHKPGRRLAPGEHRVAMLRAALEGEAGFRVCELELERGGLSYTFDTVRDLPDWLALGEVALHLLIGSDNLRGLERWHRVHELLELVQPIVIYREGDPRELPAVLHEQLTAEACERLERGFLRVPPYPCSSTELREALREGRGETPGLPTAVASYIERHGLYRGDPR